MKAIQMNTYGDVDVLELNDSAPVPTLNSGQILVQVRAGSINPFDWKVRKGYMKDIMPLTFPTTVGGDFSGVVTEVGIDVTDMQIGDEVCGSAIVFNGGSGAFAEFAAVNVKNASKKPANLSFEEAAAFPLVGCSAIQALCEHMNLQAGQKVLIHGGAGGIGHIAIQIAKALGAFVATTVNADDAEFVKNLGADQIIDYKNEKFEDILKDFDAVYDTVGGETTLASFKILKEKGILVSMMGQPDENLAREHKVTAIGQFTSNNAANLNKLFELMNQHKITINIDKVFSLEETSAAFKHQETSHPRGKVIVKVA